MASSNFKLFDENKSNMMSDTEYAINGQRLNGVQSGIASSQLQNKSAYQASLMSYALAQLMLQNGVDANDSDAVSTFVSNLSASVVQKVLDKATNEQAVLGIDDIKYVTSANLKAAITAVTPYLDTIVSTATKQKYGLSSTNTPNDVFSKIPSLISGVDVTKIKCTAFFANGTFTMPTNVLDNKVKIICVGGGGGGQYSSVSTVAGGGGGGGHITIAEKVLTPNAKYAVVVGAGGTAGISDGKAGAGGAGGTTSFGGTLVTAAGGGGGGYYDTSASMAHYTGGSGGSGGGGGNQGGNGGTYGGGGGGSQGGNGGTYGGGGGAYSNNTVGTGGTYGGNGGNGKIAAQNGTMFSDNPAKLFPFVIPATQMLPLGGKTSDTRNTTTGGGGGGYGGAGGYAGGSSSAGGGGGGYGGNGGNGGSGSGGGGGGNYGGNGGNGGSGGSGGGAGFFCNGGDGYNSTQPVQPYTEGGVPGGGGGGSISSSKVGAGGSGACFVIYAET